MSDELDDVGHPIGEDEQCVVEVDLAGRRQTSDRMRRSLRLPLRFSAQEKAQVEVAARVSA